MDKESIELVQYFTIESKIESNEFIQIYFDVPKNYIKKIAY